MTAGKQLNIDQISPNMCISNNPGFGNYRKDYIHGLLTSVDLVFSNSLDTEPFTSKPCFIDYTPGNPKCKSVKGEASIILVSASENNFSRWVYEFSHEYCHHLIDGAMEPEITGLIWFEETLCELSSFYMLHSISTIWSNSHDIKKLLSTHLFREDLHARLEAAGAPPTNLAEWLSYRHRTLSEPVYHRKLYSVLAKALLPFFLANPSLWKLILHIGDSRKWDSLDHLFQYLHLTADNSYAESLRSLEALLLG